MIIFRYITKEITTVLMVVTAILLLIFLSNQFVRYLNYIADGRLFNGLLFDLMLLEIPNLLGLLLPLGLFLGILLVFGRLQAENEMTVLAACGMSRSSLMLMTLCCTLVVAIMVGVLTLWATPHLFSIKNRLLTQTDNTSLLVSLLPGRFQAINEGQEVFYVENMSRDHKKVGNVFVAERSKNPNTEAGGEWTVFAAKEGYQYRDKKSGDQFIAVKQGYRYQGTPGQQDYRIVRYGEYGVRLQTQPKIMVDAHKTLTTSKLWQEAAINPQIAAELQWRLSVPIMAFLLGVLAVPLSRVKPRQGRYAALLPAILIYVIYANMMFVGRAWVADGTVSAAMGMWWIHAIILVLALLLLPSPTSWKTLFYRLGKRRPG
jgi:lipopolysaccharide export system permease protein